MRGDWVLGAKAGLGVGMSLLALLAYERRSIRALRGRRLTLAFMGTLVATRLGLYVALFGFAGLAVSSDAVAHYYPQARAVLDGLVPYRDFPSSYGVGFPYIAALPVRLWDAPESLVAFAIGMELVSAAVWLAVARRLTDEATVRVATFLYAASPVPLVNVAVNGQNQVWVSVGLALALFWLVAGRALVSGFALSVTAVAVKFLVLLFAPILFLGARRRVTWSAGCAAGMLMLLAWGAFASVDVLFPVRAEAPLYSSGNLPFVLGLIGLDLDQPGVQRILTGAVVGALAGVVLISATKRNPRNATWPVHVITLVLLTFLLVSRKAFTNYLVMAFFPLCLSLALSGVTRWTAILFGVLGTVAVVEPSVWFRWMDQRGLWRGAAIGSGADTTRLVVWTFLGLELVLLAGYAWLAGRAWRGLMASGQPAARLA